LDASRPEGVTETIAAETIQALHTLVVQFTRDIVRRVIALRRLDFALRAHTKVWRLGERLIRPPHVRRALELRGGAWMSKHTHFSTLLERFSEAEASSSEDADDDVPLAVRARKRKAKTVVRDTEEDDGDDDDGGGEEQQQQQQQYAGASSDAQARGAAARRWSYTHRTMYAPFVYAPDIIAPAHPFGVYAPGTTPETLAPSTSLLRPADEDGDYLMPAETDDEALETELSAEARLDAADSRAAAAYEAGVWRELRDSHNNGDGGREGAVPPRRRKRRRAGAEAAVDDAHDQPMRLCKRRKGAQGWCTTVPADMLKSPDGVVVKSAAVIEDSDLDDEHLG
jgi:hypothetical protein